MTEHREPPDHLYLACIVGSPIAIAIAVGWPWQSAGLSAVATAALLAWRKAAAGHWWLLVPPVEDSAKMD